MKKEEECVTEMLTDGQIEPSDKPVVFTGRVGDEERRVHPVLCGLRQTQ